MWTFNEQGKWKGAGEREIERREHRRTKKESRRGTEYEGMRRRNRRGRSSRRISGNVE
jgi:hypothetical protein